MTTETKTRGDRALLVVIAVISCIVLFAVGLSGFILSWETITGQAAKVMKGEFESGFNIGGFEFGEGMRHANLFTLAVDGVIVVLGLIRIANAMVGRKMMMIIIGQASLIAFTVVLNFSAGDDFKSGMIHVAPPALYVFVMEVITAIMMGKYEDVEKKAQKKASFTIFEWALAPLRTASMWRNMKRWKLFDFDSIRRFETMAIMVKSRLSTQDRAVSSVEKFVLLSEITDHINDCNKGIDVRECCTLHATLHELLHADPATNCATLHATPQPVHATTPATLHTDVATLPERPRATNRATRPQARRATNRKPDNPRVTAETIAENLRDLDATPEDRGIQQRLAERMGVHKATISRVMKKANGSLQDVTGE